MKQFLRRAVCAAAMLLLIVCPVKALAADSLIPAAAGVGGTSGGGNTTFDIIEIDTWRYLTVTVKDMETNAPLSGVTVQLYQENSATPITGSQETGFITGQDGKIRFRLSKNEALQYYIVIEYTGFERYQGEPFCLSDRENEQNVGLTPLYFTVSYHAGKHGSIPAGGESERVRWGKAPKQQPTVTAELYYPFSHWTLDGNKVELSQLKIKQDTDLYACYLRQYLVRYEAGSNGYLVGSLQELVLEGETPRHIPTPVPASDQEYQFANWQIDGEVFPSSIDPATVVITKDTTFLAVFEKNGRPGPVPPEKPDHNPGDQTVSPQPVLSPETPTGESPEGNTAAPLPSESLPHQQKEPPVTPRQDKAERTEVISPEPEGASSEPEQPGGIFSEPELPGGAPSAPADSQQNQEVHPCWLHWLILLCALLTLAAGLLRLLVIHRTIRRLDRREKEVDKERKESRDVNSKAIAAELVTGIVCAAVWWLFFIARRCHWDIWALFLWAIILLGLTVLLFRGERGLRHVAEGNET